MLNYSRYRRVPVVELKDRKWPNNEIQKAPIWCSVDLRDGNQALIEPMVVEEKIEFFNLLVKLGFKEIEIGFPSASQLEFDFLRRLVDENLIPTGELRDVAGTPFDFRKPTVIGSRIEQDDEQLKIGGGYDHNWVLNQPQSVEDFKNRKMECAASLYEPTTGRVMEVYTSEPGVQFYCGNFLDGTIKGKDGKSYARRSGMCLETQHFPDSPNQPNFPSTILRPGKEYQTVTIFRFDVKKD